MPTETHVWIGTRKGAFVFRTSDRRSWVQSGPLFPGEEVHHVAQDPRDPKRLYAAVGTSWFGSHIYASTDGGETWAQSEAGVAEAKLPDKKLGRIWHIAPGAADEPGVVYMGAEPAVLFRSEDNGATWQVVEGLTQHATRDKWMAGAGGLMVHSIQPLGQGRVVVGISAAGAFRTFDHGQTWAPFNGNVLADFSPDKFPEVGQCVHKLLAHPRTPGALYQQNHCGVYRAGIDDKEWVDISAGLPSRFGFCLAVPAGEAETLFTIPIQGPEARYVPEGKLRVARSRDGGRNWTLLTQGLPQQNAHVLVQREAMASDDHDAAGIYFGTTGGTVFYSATAGDEWAVLGEYLPPVYSVSVAHH
jgi:hypothetical protein